MNLSYKDKESLVDDINNMDPDSLEISYIKELILSSNEKYTLNNNGLFIDIGSISDVLLTKIYNYVQEYKTYLTNHGNIKQQSPPKQSFGSNFVRQIDLVPTIPGDEIENICETTHNNNKPIESTHNTPESLLHHTFLLQLIKSVDDYINDIESPIYYDKSNYHDEDYDIKILDTKATKLRKHANKSITKKTVVKRKSSKKAWDPSQLGNSEAWSFGESSEYPSRSEGPGYSKSIYTVDVQSELTSCPEHSHNFTSTHPILSNVLDIEN